MSDTQDEAERYVEEQYPESPIEVIIGISQAFKAGYRAGVATVADKHLELATKYSDLAGKYEKLVEHRNRILDGGLDRMTERDEACAELTATKAEVERLKEREKYLEARVAEEFSDLRFAQEQLAAEKAKADETKIGSCELLTAIFRVKDHSQKEVMNKADRLGKILSHKIEFYSTDSGDGVG